MGKVKDLWMQEQEKQIPRDGRWVIVYYEEEKYTPTLGRYNPLTVSWSDTTETTTIGDQTITYEIQVVDRTPGELFNWWPEDRIEDWEDIDL